VAVEHHPVEVEGMAQVVKELGAVFGASGTWIDRPGAASAGQVRRDYFASGGEGPNDIHPRPRARA
jgi:hypothetical protein